MTEEQHRGGRMWTFEQPGALAGVVAALVLTAPRVLR